MRYMDRSDLLARLTSAVIEGTLADTSLRNLASAAGTSARMLIYHFGTREALVRDVAGQITRSWREVASEASAESEGVPPSVELTRIWHTLSARRNERLIRALMQLQGRAVSGADGLDDGAALAIPILRETVGGVVERSALDARAKREITSLLAFAFWAAAEYVVTSRDRVAANEGVLGLIERLGLDPGSGS